MILKKALDNKIFLKAPYFSSTDDQGNTITLDDFKGKNLLLFFYPYDFSPTCAVDAYVFKCMYEECAGLNIEFVGVSRDNAKVHQKYKKTFNLPFRLVCDKSRIVGTIYDVYKYRTTLGVTHPWMERSTFLINKKGEIVKEWRRNFIAKRYEEVKAVVLEQAKK